MDDFEKELKSGFLEEATQLLSDVEQCFLSLEGNPDDPAILDKIFRLAHNLKGSSKAVGFNDLGAFTHEFESFLLKLKNGAIPVDSDSVNLLLRGNDLIRATVDALKGDFEAKVDHAALTEEMQKFESRARAPAPAPLEAQVEKPEPIAEEEFIDPAAIEKLVAAETGMGTAPVPVLDVVPEVAEVACAAPPSPPVVLRAVPSEPAKAAPAPATAGASTSEESIRVSLSRLEKLLDFVGEMVILQTVLREQANKENSLLIRRTVHQLGKVTKEIQDLSMSMRMVPLKQTFQKMQRIVRDTSKALGKQVNLVIEGEETEVDKTVLENLGDPLVHLIRNAVDHGIETPDERAAKGKSQAGTLTLRAFHQSGKLLIEITDDGAGIDGARLLKKAIEKGILKPGATLSEKESVHLIFAAGFSTKTEVTDVSGRGVGMDVVKTNIEKLQGEIQVETKVGSGTVFRIVLPLTLAIIDGMVVRLGEDRFVIPLSHVHESMKVRPGDLHQTTGAGEVLQLRGETLPIFRLHQLIGKKSSAKVELDKNADQIAIIVRSQSQPFAALVDDIIGQHQVVIKKLGLELQQLKGMSGSAILGDGRPALILELPELIQSQRRTA